MLLPLATYIAALILFFQTPAAPTDKPKEKAPCMVSGQVVTAAEGSALKSARVVLKLEQQSNDRKIYAAFSDSSGRWVIKGVPAGRYQFFAIHNGYVDEEYQSSGN